MSYHINYSLVSLDQFKEKLEKTELVPSRQVLHQETDQIFEVLSAFGFGTVQDLLTQIKNKKKLKSLAQATAIDEHYLTILSREIRSTLPKAEKLADLKGFEPEIFEILKENGFNNTKQLWEAGLKNTDRERISLQSQIEVPTINKLVCLSDLCRVRWVNNTFSHILWMAEIKTAQDLSTQDYMPLYHKVVDLNNKHQWYKAKIGKNDFKLVINAAKELSFDLEIESI